MSITATFTANFTSFNDAVQKADAKLKDFGEGADKVGKKLERMANEFSGRQVVQDATVMARGDREHRRRLEADRAGTRSRPARRPRKPIAKMKALGMEVPAGIQKIATRAGRRRED